jgi:hypothetical protein
MALSFRPEGKILVPTKVRDLRTRFLAMIEMGHRVGNSRDCSLLLDSSRSFGMTPFFIMTQPQRAMGQSSEKQEEAAGDFASYIWTDDLVRVPRQGCVA